MATQAGCVDTNVWQQVALATLLFQQCICRSWSAPYCFFFFLGGGDLLRGSNSSTDKTSFIHSEA